MARRRSGRQSPLPSAAATEYGEAPGAKGCWAAKEAVVAAGAVVFSSSDTVVEPKKGLARRRSGRPSPLTSAAATETGTEPVAKVCWAAKEGTVAPGAVVFSSTDAVA